MPGVADAEGRRSATARLVTGPEESIELQLTALPDFTAQEMDLVTPDDGSWPPKRGEIWFERSTGTLTDLEVGRQVEIQLGPDRTKTLTTGGIAHEPGTAPAYFFGQALGYVTFDTLADLGFDDSFDELRIRTDVADPTRGREPGDRERGEGPDREGGLAGRVRPGADARASTRPRTCSTRCSSSSARSAA